MVIDSSALVAILFNEPEAVLFLSRMAAADICRLSAASFVELGIVLRRDPTGRRRQAFDEMLRAFSVRIEPVTEDQARLAVDAYDRFGKGTGACRRPQLRRLLQLRARQGAGRAPAVQGRRLHPDRHRGRMLIGYARVSKGDDQSNAL